MSNIVRHPNASFSRGLGLNFLRANNHPYLITSETHKARVLARLAVIASMVLFRETMFRHISSLVVCCDISFLPLKAIT
jgi:hypothetical protein